MFIIIEASMGNKCIATSLLPACPFPLLKKKRVVESSFFLISFPLNSFKLWMCSYGPRKQMEGKRRKYLRDVSKGVNGGMKRTRGKESRHLSEGMQRKRAKSVREVARNLGNWARGSSGCMSVRRNVICLIDILGLSANKY